MSRRPHVTTGEANQSEESMRSLEKDVFASRSNPSSGTVTVMGDDAGVMRLSATVFAD